MIYIYNRFVHVENKVEEALSGIDVALARRYSTLINLVEIVKEYMKHESEVLLTVCMLRNPLTIKEREDVIENQQRLIESLLVLKESYPELKANEQFLSLQAVLVDLEEHLAASRRMYNSNVSQYNDLVGLFPSNLIGNMIHAKKKEYFEASDREKENVHL